jgi:hypothetical protein
VPYPKGTGGFLRGLHLTVSLMFNKIISELLKPEHLTNTHATLIRRVPKKKGEYLENIVLKNANVKNRRTFIYATSVHTNIEKW